MNVWLYDHKIMVKHNLQCPAYTSVLHVSFDAFSDGNQFIIIYTYQLATGGYIVQGRIQDFLGEGASQAEMTDVQS